MKLISVIVPIFNSQNYLKDCIESLINQSYRNIEIILVDDGSTDLSLRICEEYAELDNRIIVVHKENAGVSSARNIGLDMCKGDYVTFVDSDDFVKNKYVEELYNLIVDTKADIAVCDYIIVSNGVKQHHKQSKYGLFTSKDFMPYFLSLKVEMDECWGKLFSKRVISDNRFENYCVSEDSLFVFSCLTDAKSIVVENKDLYYYRQTKNSIMNTANAKKHYDACITADLMLKKSKDLRLDKKVVVAAKERVIKYGFYVFFIAKKEKDLEIENNCRKIILAYRKNILTEKNISLKTKISCVLSYFGLNFLNTIYKFLK